MTALGENLKKAEDLIQPRAEEEVAFEMPIGAIVKIAAEEAKEMARLRPLRVAIEYGAKPLAWAASQVNRGVQSLIGLFTKKRPPEVKDRRELERARLEKETKQLIDVWRSAFAEVDTKEGMLGVDRYRPIIKKFLALSIPEPSVDWENYVRLKAREWCEQHPWACFALTTAPSLLAVAGLGLLVLDLTVTWGMVTMVLGPGWAAGGTVAGVAIYKNLLKLTVAGQAINLHAIGAAAGVGGLAAALLKILDRLKMTELVKDATLKWLDLRIAEVKAHITVHLFSPLFTPWINQLAELKEADPEEADSDESRKACNRIEECTKVCHRIEAIATELANRDAGKRS